MAIEIKELIIKTSVLNDEKKNNSLNPEKLKEIKKEILSDCMDMMKDFIKNQDER